MPTLAPSMTFALFCAQLKDANEAFKVLNDPNATALEKANAATNAAALVADVFESFNTIFGPAATLGGLVTTQAELIYSISQYHNDPTTDNLNKVIQDTGQSISSIGNLLRDGGERTDNLVWMEAGVAIQAWGNGITWANQNYALIPTKFTDPIFYAFDELQNFGSWLGGVAFEAVQALSSSTPSTVDPTVTVNPDGSVTTQYPDGSASTTVTNPDNSTTVSTASNDGSTSVIHYNADGSVSNATVRTVNADGTYSIGTIDANNTYTRTDYNANDEVISTDTANSDGTGSASSSTSNSSTNVEYLSDGSRTITIYDSNQALRCQETYNADGSNSADIYSRLTTQEILTSVDGKVTVNFLFNNRLEQSNVFNTDGSWIYYDYNNDGITAIKGSN